MVFKKKEPELTQYQANLLRVLTTTPMTAPEIYMKIKDPYAGKRAESLCSMGLATRSEQLKELPSGKIAKRSHMAWALTEKGLEWQAKLKEMDEAKLAEEPK